jgi:hypothetical protein
MASKSGLWGPGYGRRRGVTVSVKSNGVHRVTAARRSGALDEPRCFLACNPLQLAGMIGAPLDTRQDCINLVNRGPVAQKVR